MASTPAKHQQPQQPQQSEDGGVPASAAMAAMAASAEMEAPVKPERSRRKFSDVLPAGRRITTEQGFKLQIAKTRYRRGVRTGPQTTINAGQLIASDSNTKVVTPAEYEQSPLFGYGGEFRNHTNGSVGILIPNVSSPSQIAAVPLLCNTASVECTGYGSASAAGTGTGGTAGASAAGTGTGTGTGVPEKNNAYLRRSSLAGKENRCDLVALTSIKPNTEILVEYGAVYELELTAARKEEAAARTAEAKKRAEKDAARQKIYPVNRWQLCRRVVEVSDSKGGIMRVECEGAYLHSKGSAQHHLHECPSVVSEDSQDSPEDFTLDAESPDAEHIGDNDAGDKEKEDASGTGTGTGTAAGTSGATGESGASCNSAAPPPTPVGTKKRRINEGTTGTGTGTALEAALKAAWKDTESEELKLGDKRISAKFGRLDPECVAEGYGEPRLAGVRQIMEWMSGSDRSHKRQKPNGTNGDEASASSSTSSNRNGSGSPSASDATRSTEPSIRFVDLGSGRGKVVMAAGLLLPGVVEATGVELLLRRYEMSVAKLEALRESYTHDSDITARLSAVSFLERDLCQFDLNPYTHVFVFGAVFTDTMLKRIWTKLEADESKWRRVVLCVRQYRQPPIIRAVKPSGRVRVSLVKQTQSFSFYLYERERA